MTGYVNALKLRFEDKDAKDEAYAELEEVRYEGCIRDMFTRIQTLNDKAMVSGAALKKLILEWLPQKILDQMHVVDLTGKTDNEIIAIITSAGRTAEKWEAARKNLGLKATFRTFSKARQSKYEEETEKPERRKHKKDRFRKTDRKTRKYRSGEKIKENRSGSNLDFTKTEGVDPSELSRRRAAGECVRCAWHADQKGTHKVRDCQRPAKLDKGTASLPKPKEYQKIKDAAVGLHSEGSEGSESSEDSSSTESTYESDDSDDSGDSGDSQGECLDRSSEELEQDPQDERNWWDSSEDSD